MELETILAASGECLTPHNVADVILIPVPITPGFEEVISVAQASPFQHGRSAEFGAHAINGAFGRRTTSRAGIETIRRIAFRGGPDLT